MKLPRNLSGIELARALGTYGQEVTLQAGSHTRLTTQDRGQHHVTIPAHHALRVGTLSNILREVAIHFEVTRDEVVERLFA